MRDRIQDNLAILEKIPFFSHYSDEVKQHIAEKMMELPFEKDEVILHEGSEGRRLYIIEKGTVGVFKGDKQIATLEAGMFFGEISLITSEARTASVKALDDVTTLVLHKDDFQELLKMGFFQDQGVKDELFRRIKENYDKGY